MSDAAININVTLQTYPVRVEVSPQIGGPSTGAAPAPVYLSCGPDVFYMTLTGASPVTAGILSCLGAYAGFPYWATGDGTTDVTLIRRDYADGVWRWYVISFNSAGEIVYQTKSTTDSYYPIGLTWSSPTVGTGTPTVTPSPLEAESANQICYVGSEPVFEIWQQNGESLTNWTTIFLPSQYAEANHTHTPLAIGAARAMEVKTTSFTAVVGGRYICEGTVGITDPATNASGGALAAGDSYEFWIGSGTATVSSIAYSPSRFSIRRRYTGTAWATPTPYLTDALDFASSAKAQTLTNLGAVSQASFDTLRAIALLRI